MPKNHGTLGKIKKDDGIESRGLPIVGDKHFSLHEGVFSAASKGDVKPTKAKHKQKTGHMLEEQDPETGMFI